MKSATSPTCFDDDGPGARAGPGAPFLDQNATDRRRARGRRGSGGPVLPSPRPQLVQIGAGLYVVKLMTAWFRTAVEPDPAGILRW